MGILDFSLLETEAVEQFEKAAAVSWLYGEARKIQNAFWLYDNSHILFKDQDQLYLLENFYSDQRQIKSLVEVDKRSDFFFSEADSYAYFLTHGDRHFARIELVPRKNLSAADKKEGLVLAI